MANTKVKIDLILDPEQFDKWTDFLVWFKKDVKKKKEKPFIPSTSICGVSEIGPWCYNCGNDKMKCKLYVDKLR